MSYTILQEMMGQGNDINVDDWLCLACVNYLGKLRCQRNVFIAFTGANMSLCCYYQQSQICIHCGNVT